MDTPPSGVTITMSSRWTPWTAKSCRSWPWRRRSMVLGAVGGNFGRRSTASTPKPRTAVRRRPGRFGRGAEVLEPAVVRGHTGEAPVVIDMQDNGPVGGEQPVDRSHPGDDVVGRGEQRRRAGVQEPRERSHHRPALLSNQSTTQLPAKGATVGEAFADGVGVAGGRMRLGAPKLALKRGTSFVMSARAPFVSAGRGLLQQRPGHFLAMQTRGGAVELPDRRRRRSDSTRLRPTL